MSRSPFLAAVFGAAMLFASPALAQEEAEAPDTYTSGEDGSATHNASGATCPGMLGDLVLAQVFSFDRGEEHLGISCQYYSPAGFNSSITIMRLDAAELVGAGSQSARWNRAIYSVWDRYGSVLPQNIEGLEGDESEGLFGALFTLNARGLPVHIGIWQADKGDWQFRAQTTFVGGADDWEVAELTRDALLGARASAN